MLAGAGGALATGVAAGGDRGDVAEGQVISRRFVDVPLSSGDVRTLWVEDRPPATECTVTDPDDSFVPLSRASGSAEVDEVRLKVIGSFEAKQDGRYHVKCLGRDARMTEGGPSGGGGALPGLLGGGAAFVAGAVALGVGLVARRRPGRATGTGGPSAGTVWSPRP